MKSESAQLLEPLEARIAPASAVFTDVDGDKITVAISKAKTTNDVTAVVTGGSNSEISKIDLTSFAGTDIQVSVTQRGAAGDGLANAWFIDATGKDLGKVEVSGDLAKLLVGDSSYANGSVKSVKVQSIGVHGSATDKAWAMLGGTSSFTVAGDVKGASLEWSNPAENGKLSVGAITIGGSMIGGTQQVSGSVRITTGTGGTAELKSIAVGGSLNGADYALSGSIIVGSTDSPDTVNGTIGKITIGGSLNADDNNSYTGTIFSSTIGSVTAGGSLNGGDYRSGSIFAYDKITGDVKVGGSVTGGTGESSGTIFATDSITKSVAIGGVVRGGSGGYSGAVVALDGAITGNVALGSILSGGSGIYSGAIFGSAGLGNVSIGGSVFGGSSDHAGFVGADSALYKSGDITIQGDLVGGSGPNAGVVFVQKAGAISIDGSLNGASGGGYVVVTDSLKSLNIGGDLQGGVSNYSGSVRVLGTTAKISSVTIGGSLIGTNAQYSGTVETAGSVDKFTIGGDIRGGTAKNSGGITFGSIKALSVGNPGAIGASITGGSGTNSGFVTGSGALTTATFAGSIVGGTNTDTGKIDVASVKDITIGGNLSGGSGSDSGKITLGAGGLTGKLTVQGNVVGSSNTSNTGVISINGNPGAKAIEIQGSLIGGNTTSTNKSNSGAILVSNGMLKSLTIGGDIKAGTYFDSTDLNLGAVRAGSIDTMLVKGGLVGADSNSRVLITGKGDASKTSGTNLAIKSLTVQGSVSNAMILGGYDASGSTKNGNGGSGIGGGAQIGTVTVLGDFFNGSIATGVSNNTNNFGSWADGNNILLSQNSIVASIAKIVIQGAATADTQSGIAAEKIQSLTIGGLPVTIGSGAQFINPITTSFKAQQVVA